MKYLSSFLFLSIIWLTSCEKSPSRFNCIDETIENFQGQLFCNSGSQVDQYSFLGETVYVLVQGNCGADFSSEVLDVRCNTIGHVGGISGNTEIQGEDFNSATFVITLWEQ